MGNKWTIEKIEKTLINSSYGDLNLLPQIIENSINKYLSVIGVNDEVSNRLSILRKLQIKYPIKEF